MSAQLTVRPEAGPSDESSWVQTFNSRVAMPPDLMKQARKRLGWLALVIGCMCMVFGPIAVMTWPADGAAGLVPWAVRTAIVAVISFALYFTTRASRVGDTTVLLLGLAFEILMCLSDNTFDTWAFYSRLGEPPMMTSSSVFIVVFPLLVPCRPWLTVAASLLAAATTPLGLAIGYWAGYIGEPSVSTLVRASISPFGCVILAYMGSRIIHNMGAAVAKARRLGSYTLEELLGRGGMGEVWRASHQMLARPAAVKLIHPKSLAVDTATAQTVLARFDQEAQATASLRSPHTVELYDFGRADDGAFYYVMELLDGLDLATLVEKFGPQHPARVIYLMVQVCRSLDEAHRAGLVHRDIKPANLFVCRYGTEDDFMKVLDFGLVKEVHPKDGDTPTLSQHGAVVGTPGFMPPELLLNSGDADGRADLYGLGCVAFWLLTGQLVFEGDSSMALMVQHANAVPPTPSSRSDQDIPDELEAIILSCLAKDPAERPDSARELARRLTACAVDEPWTAERASEWWEMNRPTLSATIVETHDP